jgi:ribosome maturation factor RimP
MKRTPLEQKLTLLIQPVIEDLGFQLVLASVIGEGGTKTVQVLAQDPGTRNLGVEDCGERSAALSPPFSTSKTRSKGIQAGGQLPRHRPPLVQAADFEHYKGYEAKLETYDAFWKTARNVSAEC